MKNIVLALLAFVVCSCGSKEKEYIKEDELVFSVKDYAYSSVYGALHLTRYCSNIEPVVDRGEKGEKIVEFIPKSELKRNYLKALCPRCISDRAYEELVKIIEENEKRAAEEEISSDTLADDWGLE